MGNLTTTYDSAKNIIKNDLASMSKKFITIGYYLKYIRDNEMYTQDGFTSIWEFAQETYGISKSTCSRWMSMNDKFSEDGNSPYLKEEFADFGKSQLQEMLYLDNAQIEKATPEMTAKEIRQLKEPENIPGQMEIQDFPEFLPEGQQEEAVPYFTLGGEAYGRTWNKVVEAYLAKDYKNPESGTEVKSLGKMYLVLRRKERTFFYDSQGNTLFEVENKRLEKEYEYMQEEDAAKTAAEPERITQEEHVATAKQDVEGEEQQAAGQEEQQKESVALAQQTTEEEIEYNAIAMITMHSVVQIADSAEAFMEEFKIFGKSEQITTTGAQLLDESQIEQNDSRGFKYLNFAVGEGNFTLSSNIPKSPTDQSAYIMLVSGNVKALGSEITSNSNGVYSGRSRTFPSKDGYMTIAYRNDSNTNKLITFNKYWYMLNAGDTAKPYEPFTGGKPSPSPDYPQEIKTNAENGEINANVITGNLFPIDKFKKYEINNSAKQITLNGDRISFTGKGTTGKEDMVFFLNKEADKLSLPPGKYTLSFKSNKPYGGTNGENTVEMYLIVEKKSGTVYQSTGNAGNRTVDIEDGDKMYFRFDINNNSMSAEFYDIMFNLGDTPLPYEPYAEQSLAIQTPDGLPGIPVTSGGNYTDSTGRQWVCDEICEQGGVIGVKKI